MPSKSNDYNEREKTKFEFSAFLLLNILKSIFREIALGTLSQLLSFDEAVVFLPDFIPG